MIAAGTRVKIYQKCGVQVLHGTVLLTWVLETLLLRSCRTSTAFGGGRMVERSSR